MLYLLCHKGEHPIYEEGLTKEEFIEKLQDNYINWLTATFKVTHVCFEQPATTTITCQIVDVTMVSKQRTNVVVDHQSEEFYCFKTPINNWTKYKQKTLN